MNTINAIETKTNVNSKLEARVKAANDANAYANKLYRQLVEIFRPLVGQKVLKDTGGLFQKYEKLLPQFPCSPNLHVYKHYSNYSLAWAVKTCVGFEGLAYYYETVVYIGDLRDGVLTRLENYSERKTDYDAEEISELRLEYKEAKRLADEAESKLFPFGEYER